MRQSRPGHMVPRLRLPPCATLWLRQFALDILFSEPCSAGAANRNLDTPGQSPVLAHNTSRLYSLSGRHCLSFRIFSMGSNPSFNVLEAPPLPGSYTCEMLRLNVSSRVKFSLAFSMLLISCNTCGASPVLSLQSRNLSRTEWKPFRNLSLLTFIRR